MLAAAPPGSSLAQHCGSRILDLRDRRETRQRTERLDELVGSANGEPRELGQRFPVRRRNPKGSHGRSSSPAGGHTVRPTRLKQQWCG